MKLERKQTVLLIGISILLFRLLSVIVNIGIIHIRRVPMWFAMRVAMVLQAYEAVIACGVGVFLAILFMRKLRTAHLGVVFFAWILALLPFQFSIDHEIMLPPPPPIEMTAVQPISLTARLIEGESIHESILLDNTHVAGAEAVPLHAGAYQVKLHLTQTGRDAIRVVTRHNVGMKIGFFLDGDLKSSPEIAEPLNIPYIMLPIRTTAMEAKRIAQGIMKETSQQQN